MARWAVSSGDLEVLIEPGTAGHLQIQVVTSVDGSAARWAQLFQRLFEAAPGRP